VILALSAPVAAQAAAAKSLPVHGPKTSHLVRAGAHNGLKPTKPTAPTAPKPVTPPVIYVPAGAAPVQSQVELCQTQGMGCTDQQYCAYWNIACDGAGEGGTAAGTSVDPAYLLSELEAEYCCDPLSCMSLA
jgi:hypothetical protein